MYDLQDFLHTHVFLLGKGYQLLLLLLLLLLQDFLHEDFVSLVRTAECGGTPTLRPLADGVFALPVFSARFCALLCEELVGLMHRCNACIRPTTAELG